MQKPTLQNWLLYCRPGFEQDCTQEALRQAKQQKPIIGTEQPAIVADSGYVVVALNEHKLSWRELIFTRQLIRLHHSIATLPERDRLTPILDAIAALPGTFGTLWLEAPDTNEGKLLSTFTRRFQPLLETALREQGRLQDDITNTVRPELDVTTSHSTRLQKNSSQVAGYVEGYKEEASTRPLVLSAVEGSARTEEVSPRRNNHLPRLHIFFPDKNSAMIGTSDPHNSADAIMGIVRQSIPAEAPSRSTMKLAEAIEVFMDRSEQTRLLRSGMHAVDLGAAPGGWTWQLVKRGIRVTAVDNGPMKGVLATHPLVQHLKQDGFKYAPRKAVDWLVCDMVEKPSKVATLIGEWFAAGWCKHAIFNLKLPMKQRVAALDSALGGIRKRLDEEGINYRMMAKQLYHDREEVTVLLTKTKN
jgi:23S rRNA (cytidine2498-2'-O)-methyltransferase